MLDLHSLAEMSSRYPPPAEVTDFELRGTAFRFAEQRYIMGVINLSQDSCTEKAFASRRSTLFGAASNCI